MLVLYSTQALPHPPARAATRRSADRRHADLHRAKPFAGRGERVPSRLSLPQLLHRECAGASAEFRGWVGGVQTRGGGQLELRGATARVVRVHHMLNRAPPPKKI